MLCQNTCDVPLGITAIVSAPAFSRRPPQADASSASSNVVTNTLHHGGHGGREGAILNENGLNLRVPRVLRGGEVAFRSGAVVGGTIPDENGFNLRVPRVLRGGEVMPRGGDVVPRGGELITIVLQAARLPSDSRIAARCRRGPQPVPHVTNATRTR